MILETEGVIPSVMLPSIHSILGNVSRSVPSPPCYCLNETDEGYEWGVDYAG
jgi:hypothetical protein